MGKVLMLYGIFRNDPVHYLFGAGFGITKGQNIFGVSNVGVEFEKLFAGSRPLLFTTMFQGGILFAGVILAIMISSWKRNSRSTLLPAEKKMGALIAFVLATMWIYNEALLVSYFTVIFTYFMVWIRANAERTNTTAGSTGASDQRPTTAAL
jgi:hypothetical protein